MPLVSQRLPLVSIIIPVYNGKNYLRLAVESALAQTYPRIEVIVVNDGSTDSGATESICQGFGSRIKYFVKENGGVSSALNYGLERMEGQYFSWLSHDDLYFSDKIIRQVEFLQSHPEARIVGSGLEIIDENGNVLNNYSPEGGSVVRTGRDAMDIWIHGCSLLIDREVFSEVGKFNESNKTVQDLEMWLEIAAKGISFYFLPDILCQWRMHEESGSFAGRQEHFAEVDQFFKHLLDRYSLDFFSENKFTGTGMEKAGVYEWLGEQARHRGAVNSAWSFFWLAWLNNPNLLCCESRRRLKKLLSYLMRKNTAFVQ